MLQIIKAENRHFGDFGWLKTYWLFSFSNYYDPNNLQFGTLRVFNDDVILPGTGFNTHSHQEMEIVTIVLNGEITHKDSIGTQDVVKKGEVQRMSAGTGIAHSEHNLGDQPLHIYQIWLYPNVSQLKPSYEQKSFANFDQKNQFLPLVSGQGLPDVVKIYSDANIYLAEIEANQILDFKTDQSRGTFVYITNGDITINNQRLTSKDQARIVNEDGLQFQAYAPTSLILIDVPYQN
jgi:redox-sensitive bicupin YhaK (pirin superfamily)